jgi:hypothetical protein
MLFEVPWPSDELAFTQTVTLSGEPYLLTMRWVEAPDWVRVLSVPDDVPVALADLEGNLLTDLEGNVLVGLPQGVVPITATEPQGSWLMTITDRNGEVVEQGIRLVGGTRFGWRRVNGNEPLGELKLLTPNGQPMPDLPSIEDMQQRRVVLAYDDPLL